MVKNHLHLLKEEKHIHLLKFLLKILEQGKFIYLYYVFSEWFLTFFLLYFHRYFMMNTLFNLVDACLFSDLVEFYENLVRN